MRRPRAPSPEINVREDHLVHEQQHVVQRQQDEAKPAPQKQARPAPHIAPQQQHRTRRRRQRAQDVDRFSDHGDPFAD